jgi:hypothetical protein
MFPPATAAKAVLFSIDDDDGIRPLERVANVPTLRQDGSLLNVPGYDSASRLFYRPVGNIPAIPERPTQKDARAAAAWILDMISEFPFDSDASRDNFLGLLMTFPVRQLCGCVPLALIDAPIAGSGKTHLSGIACLTAIGEDKTLGVEFGDAAETRKNITSRLREGPSIIVTDNVSGIINSPILAACLTAKTWEDRILGRSQMLSLPVKAVFVATGNNIRVGGDMPRRCFLIRIDANTTQPWMRNGFKHELPTYAIQNKGRIVASLLTMARAWLCAGRPRGSNPVLGSFESWCKIVGGILEYSGMYNFLGNLDEMRASTADGVDDADQWNAWMTAIHTHFEEAPFTIAHLSDVMNSPYAGELRDEAPYSLGDVGLTGETSWMIRLGNALNLHKGQVFNIENGTIKLTQIVDKHARKKIYRFINFSGAS